MIIGLTRGTTRAHLVRATVEAIAHEVRDVVDTMPALTSLMVDGGAAANNLLCQLQADQLGVEVRRPTAVETTALGAAFLAGLGVGVWSGFDELRATWSLDRAFTPVPDREAADRAHRRWSRAVERAKGWAS
jgi:glycerol kinase